MLRLLFQWWPMLVINAKARHRRSRGKKLMNIVHVIPDNQLNWSFFFKFNEQWRLDWNYVRKTKEKKWISSLPSRYRTWIISHQTLGDHTRCHATTPAADRKNAIYLSRLLINIGCQRAVNRVQRVIFAKTKRTTSLVALMFEYSTRCDWINLHSVVRPSRIVPATRSDKCNQHKLGVGHWQHEHMIPQTRLTMAHVPLHDVANATEIDNWMHSGEQRLQYFFLHSRHEPKTKMEQK